MGWELHIVRTEHWFDSANDPICSEEWLQLVDSDDELSIDHKNGNFYAIWSGQSEHDEPWLEWGDGRISTKHPDEALYCKMLQIADKLNAVVVDEDDHKYLLPSDLMNPSWVNSSSTGKKTSLWDRLTSKLK
ncbi:TPA: hypothetical protein ACIFUM_003283 [Salmonella enterica]|uniref:Uncharacterized protein n=1 Tax=Salmonella enterica subsp. enterica serovar Cerro TaxID=340188 RepID=A0A5W5IBB5_SALET|nr:hypothetical protein [Salmonella enterica subsp. enterica serovar Cerro]ECV6025776.1 hypothetical protein [Salmonella enterica]EDA5911906.1 hypothetical protein [Salmonella enterica subsp. enterica serovar Cerro]EHI7371381.1 hypothetical protein [Salmonella enterica]ELY6968851.1 hypothetical protein [Salmonella enterica]